MRTLSRTPPIVRRQPEAVARHRPAAGGRGGVRRPARRAGGDRPHQRRRARVRVQAGLRSQPLRRRHRFRELAGAERVARQAAAQPAAARRVSARLDDQAVPRAGGAALGQANAGRRRSSIPATSRSRGSRTASATTSPAATVWSTCTSRSSCPATPTTTCWRARPTSTTRHASCRSSASAQKTGIDIEGELTGVLPSRAWKRAALRREELSRRARKWYLGDSISAGIGQGYNAFTPIQLAHAIAMLANDGVGYTPHLVKSVQDTRTGASRADRARAVVAARRQARAARGDQERAGRRRQGRDERGGVVKDAKYVSAGKTGTAQVFSLKGEKYSRARVDERLRDHAWFIAYAPADQPKIAARRPGRERRIRRARRRRRSRARCSTSTCSGEAAAGRRAGDAADSGRRRRLTMSDLIAQLPRSAAGRC